MWLKTLTFCAGDAVERNVDEGCALAVPVLCRGKSPVVKTPGMCDCVAMVCADFFDKSVGGGFCKSVNDGSEA